MAEWMLDDVTSGQETAQARDMVPEGEHVFEVVKATEGPHKFREGEFLSLRLSDAGKKWALVFADIPKDKRGAPLAASLAKALGLGGFGSKVVIDPAELEGRQVIAEIYHTVSKAGRTYANVRRFSAVEQAAPAAARTPKQKADKAATATDDIPF